MWQNWINAVLGLWLILSGYVGLDAASMATNVTIVGIVLAVLAVWVAVGERSPSLIRAETRTCLIWDLCHAGEVE